jgi:hypothetical protein
MLKDLSYAAFGLLVMVQRKFGDRPFLLKDVLNRGESTSSTKRLLRELVDGGFISSVSSDNQQQVISQSQVTD